MKERIVFFVLGAILTTFGYFVGDMNNISAQGEYIKVFDDHVKVKGNLYVDGALIVRDKAFMENSLAVKNSIRLSREIPGNKNNQILFVANENSVGISQYLNYPNDANDASDLNIIPQSLWIVMEEFSQLELKSVTGFSFVDIEDSKMHSRIYSTGQISPVSEQ